MNDDFPSLGGGSGGFGGRNVADFAGNDFPDFPPISTPQPKAKSKTKFDPRGADRPTTTGTYNKPQWQAGQGGFGASSSSSSQNQNAAGGGGGNNPNKKTKKQKQKEMMALLQGKR